MAVQINATATRAPSPGSLLGTTTLPRAWHRSTEGRVLEPPWNSLILVMELSCSGPHFWAMADKRPRFGGRKTAATFMGTSARFSCSSSSLHLPLCTTPHEAGPASICGLRLNLIFSKLASSVFVQGLKQSGIHSFNWSLRRAEQCHV